MIKWPLKAKMDTKEEEIPTILTVVRGGEANGNEKMLKMR